MDIVPFVKCRPCVLKKHTISVETISGSNIHDYAKSRIPFNWNATLLNNAISKIEKNLFARQMSRQYNSLLRESVFNACCLTASIAGVISRIRNVSMNCYSRVYNPLLSLNFL